MKRIVERLRARTSLQVRQELAVGMVVMADVDRRRRGLRDVIVPLFEEEKVMESWLYKQGEEKGIEKGIETGARRTLVDSLRGVFVRRAGRQPTAEEEQTLARRARDVSPDQLVEIFEMPRDAFLGWLAAG